jgi:hypothetical protein
MAVEELVRRTLGDGFVYVPTPVESINTAVASADADTPIVVLCAHTASADSSRQESDPLRTCPTLGSEPPCSGDGVGFMSSQEALALTLSTAATACFPSPSTMSSHSVPGRPCCIVGAGMDWETLDRHLTSARQQGEWLLVVDAHMLVGWLLNSNHREGDTHENFRLFLYTFPSSHLHNSECYDALVVQSLVLSMPALISPRNVLTSALCLVPPTLFESLKSRTIPADQIKDMRSVFHVFFMVLFFIDKTVVIANLVHIQFMERPRCVGLLLLHSSYAFVYHFRSALL